MPTSQNRLLGHLLENDARVSAASNSHCQNVIQRHHLRIWRRDRRRLLSARLDRFSLSIMEDGTTIEISMVGKEGVVGLSALLGGGSSRHWTRMCIGGTVARLSTSALEHTFVSNEGALKHIMRSYSSLITQVSQRAVCNARHTVLERLACWLLMIHDRVGGENLRLTQEAIASRLGARRAGITVAAGMLQSIGAIEYRRGQLHIKDRVGLERSRV